MNFKTVSVFYLTASWTGHVHIKSYLTLILIWTRWPVRTERTCQNEKLMKSNSCLIFKELTSVFTTYDRRSCSGWIHAVHPGGSSPCLHCGWRRTTAHAPVLRSGSHHSPAPPPRSARFDSRQHWRLFGLQRVSLAGWSEHHWPLCFHSAPALPTSLSNTKRSTGGKEVKLSFMC